MAVRVRLLASLRAVAGQPEVEIEAPTVGKALGELTRRFGHNAGFKRQLKGAQAILNGTNVAHLKGRRTKLSDGDELVLFPPLCGG